MGNVLYVKNRELILLSGLELEKGFTLIEEDEDLGSGEEIDVLGIPGEHYSRLFVLVG